MVSIVLVSHSTELSMAVKALADQQIQGRASIVAVGGSDNPFQPFGTDPVAIAEAIQSVYSDDGVLVLMDLGSAVISGQVALDLLPAETRARVRLSSGPFVEGAMAAAVQASIGMDLEAVAREAAEARRAKDAVLHVRTSEATAPVAAHTAPETPSLHTAGADVIVVNPAGLHFGPAARFIQTAAQFHAEVRVTDLTTGAGPAPASRFNQLIALGIEKDHCIRIEAVGQDADEAVNTLVRQVAHDLGGETTPGVPSPAFPMIEGRGETVLSGLAASPGFAIGQAVILAEQQDLLHTDERLHADTEESGSDPTLELTRFTQAQQQALAQLNDLAAQVSATLGEEQGVIFRAHTLLLQDRDFLAEVRSAISCGQAATAAVRRAVRRWAERFRHMSGSVFQQRAVDVEDIGRRLLHLLQNDTPSPLADLPPDALIVATDLLPSQAATLDRSRVIGLCTAGGGPNAHTAILARSMGIPAVVGVGSALLEAVRPGMIVALDGAHGIVIAGPDAATAHAYAQAQADAQAARATAWASAQRLTRTHDGVRVEVVANLSAAADAALALDAGAEGVGLLRTEFLFQDRLTPPSEEEQTEIYRNVAHTFGTRRLIIRTLDIGGDKPAPYLALPREPNPFLGWRAIRISLAMPELFKTQLRALMRAGVDSNIHIMFPMIGTLDEILRAQALMAAAASELTLAGADFRADLPVGIMIETPAAVTMADRMAALVDFFSIGTNDLTQYTFAADRTNQHVAALNDPLHPAVLRQIDAVLRAAHAHARWVGLCGEMAADPLAIPILLGLGLDEFSMAPASIPAAKQLITQLTMPTARRLAQKALQLHDGASVRALVRETLGDILPI
ncbi:MAG TPA: phosphoenolpyruvate--protein phosphotransferase [Chloroflexi bacterium]|nr:phosphoenolpyruvate--protein phosphotransferase [Chloroflexota bacterium]HHW85854.1 phosphoenolpyruvate--protein phosphotransferase [Chloroflexota bacterium]